MRSIRHQTAHRLLCWPIVVTTVLAVAGCSSTDDGTVPVPSPSGKAAGACRSLAAQLPDEIDRQRRTSPEPASEYTAAWGDPSIELRCGVPRPEVLTPGSEHYNPTAEAAEVNGISWLIAEQDGGYRFTTTGRTAFVEVTVPDDYAPEIGALTEFADGIREAVPQE